MQLSPEPIQKIRSHQTILAKMFSVSRMLINLGTVLIQANLILNSHPLQLSNTRLSWPTVISMCCGKAVDSCTRLLSSAAHRHADERGGDAGVENGREDLDACLLD